MSTSTIAAKPSMCHQTEMPLIRATRWLPPMFSAVWTTRMQQNSQNVPDRKSPETPLNQFTLNAPSVKFMNVAQP